MEEERFIISLKYSTGARNWKRDDTATTRAPPSGQLPRPLGISSLVLRNVSNPRSSGSRLSLAITVSRVGGLPFLGQKRHAWHLAAASPSPGFTLPPFPSPHQSLGLWWECQEAAGGFDMKAPMQLRMLVTGCGEAGFLQYIYGVHITLYPDPLLDQSSGTLRVVCLPLLS